jgi:hypothetical protein
MPRDYPFDIGDNRLLQVRLERNVSPFLEVVLSLGAAIFTRLRDPAEMSILERVTIDFMQSSMPINRLRDNDNSIPLTVNLK